MSSCCLRSHRIKQGLKAARARVDMAKEQKKYIELKLKAAEQNFLTDKDEVMQFYYTERTKTDLLQEKVDHLEESVRKKEEQSRTLLDSLRKSEKERDELKQKLLECENETNALENEFQTYKRTKNGDNKAKFVNNSSENGKKETASLHK